MLDANDVAELAKMDIIVTCQGGDYTKSVFQPLRDSGWSFVSAQDDTVTGQMDGTSQISIRVVSTERGFYYLTSRCPLDAIEGWGARFAHMAESFAAQPPLRLSFESDVPFVKTLETVDLNESGPYLSATGHGQNGKQDGDAVACQKFSVDRSQTLMDAEHDHREKRTTENEPRHSAAAADGFCCRVSDSF